MKRGKTGASQIRDRKLSQGWSRISAQIRNLRKSLTSNLQKHKSKIKMFLNPQELLWWILKSSKSRFKFQRLRSSILMRLSKIMNKIRMRRLTGSRLRNKNIPGDRSHLKYQKRERKTIQSQKQATSKSWFRKSWNSLPCKRRSWRATERATEIIQEDQKIKRTRKADPRASTERSLRSLYNK